MDDYKLTELLDKIIRASEKGKILWEKNVKSEEAFKASLGSNTLHILKAGSNIHLSNYRFIILNETGDQLGSIEDTYRMYDLEKLYVLARKKALKIDENLDDINSILDSIL